MPMIFFSIIAAQAADSLAQMPGAAKGIWKSIGEIGKSINEFGNAYNGILAVAGFIISTLIVPFVPRLAKPGTWLRLPVTALVGCALIATIFAMIGSYSRNMLLTWLGLIALGALLLLLLLIFGVRAQRYSWAELRRLYQDVLRKVVELREGDAARVNFDSLLGELKSSQALSQSTVVSSVKHLLGIRDAVARANIDFLLEEYRDSPALSQSAAVSSARQLLGIRDDVVRANIDSLLKSIVELPALSQPGVATSVRQLLEIEDHVARGSILSLLQDFRASPASSQPATVSSVKRLLRMENEAARSNIAKLVDETYDLPSLAQTAVTPIALSSVLNLLGNITEELNVSEYTKMLEECMNHPGMKRVILFSNYAPNLWGLPPRSVRKRFAMSDPPNEESLNPDQLAAWSYFLRTAELATKMSMARVMCMPIWNPESTHNQQFKIAHARANIGLFCTNPTGDDELPYDMGLFETDHGERVVIWSKKGRDDKWCHTGVEHKNLGSYKKYLREQSHNFDWLLDSARNDSVFSWGG